MINMELLNAIQSNDIPKIKGLLTNRPLVRNLNFCNVVSLVNDAEMIFTLFNLCGNEIRNDSLKKHQQSILHGAIRADKDLKIIEAILNLDEGCINRGDMHGVTPLMLALFLNKDVELLKFLVENNADVNVCDKSGVPTLLFARIPEICKFLIENGAEVNYADENGFSLLMYALKFNKDKAIVLEVIENGADVESCNCQRQMCLHLALYYKYDGDVINRICSKIDDFNVEDVNGLTPLCYAIQDDHWTLRPQYQKDFIHDLINKGFVMDANVLMYAVVHCENDEILSSLLQHVDIRCVDKVGNCVLHCARNPKRISMLIRRGAPVNHKNNEGKTPLINAIINNQSIRIVELLLSWGATENNWEALLSRGTNKKIFLSDDVSDLLVLNGMRVSLKRNYIKRYLFNVLEAIEENSIIKKTPKGLLRHIYLSNKYVELPERLMMHAQVNKVIRTFVMELKQMKDKLIMENVSYYDFCTTKYRSVKCPFVDKGLIRADSEHIKNMFPTFFNEVIVKIMINIKINKEKMIQKKLMNVRLGKRSERQNISDKDDDFSCKVIELDCDCMPILGSYMSITDMNSLIAAAII